MSVKKPVTSDLHKEVLATFSDSLAGDPSLDASAREMLLRRVEDALVQPQESAPTDIEESLVANRAQWISTLDLLCANGALAANDRESLIAQFDAAMEPLQSEDFRQVVRAAREPGRLQPAQR